MTRARAWRQTPRGAGYREARSVVVVVVVIFLRAAIDAQTHTPKKKKAQRRGGRQCWVARRAPISKVGKPVDVVAAVAGSQDALPPALQAQLLQHRDDLSALYRQLAVPLPVVPVGFANLKMAFNGGGGALNKFLLWRRRFSSGGC